MNKRLTLVFSASLVVGTSLPASALEPVASPSPSGPLPACPSEHGGACLGPLSAGTYRTTEFETPFTFEVPDGWSNYEDLPGQVLLLPPGSTLEGVDAGTSDYIGIDQGVAVARSDCVGGPESGIRTSAEAMATAFAERDGLVVSPPVAARVGGLSGHMIDIVGDLASDAGCQVPDFPYPIVPLITGTWPADLEHAQVGDLWTTRLYLLDHGNTNIAIEVSDVATSPGVTEDYLGVIESIDFETTTE